MSDDQGVIVLYYKPGPAAGQLIAVVDAPKLSQAEFVVTERLRGTPEEQQVLRQMLNNRLEIAAAMKELDP